MKDRIAGSLAQKFLNARLGRYGEVRELRIDSRNSGGEIALHLLGEPAPLRIVISHYTVRQEDGRTLARVDAVTCERAWVQNAIQDFVCGRWYEIPNWVTLALRS